MFAHSLTILCVPKAWVLLFLYPQYTTLHQFKQIATMKIFEILLTNPEIAKNIKFEITGSDLLNLSATLMKASISGQKEMKKEKYLSRKDVSKILNKNLTTLWRWKKRKILTPNHIGLYKKSDIDKFLEKK